MMSPKLKIVELKVHDWQATVEWFCHFFSMNVLIMDRAKQYALLGEDYGTEANLSIRGTAESFTGNQFLLQWEVIDLPGIVANLAHRGVRIFCRLSSRDWTKVLAVDKISIVVSSGIRQLLKKYSLASRTQRS